MNLGNSLNFKTSIILEGLPAGQYEGFNYLGAGVLLLGTWALYELMQRPPTRNTLKSLLPLGLISLGLTLFAVSHKVTWGATVLWELDSQFVGLLSVFRSSGRFFGRSIMRYYFFFSAYLFAAILSN